MLSEIHMYVPSLSARGLRITLALSAEELKPLLICEQHTIFILCENLKRFFYNIF